MLILLGVWAAVAFLAWLFVYGAGLATELDSAGRAEHDSAIEPRDEIPQKHIENRLTSAPNPR
jgi:hypothetical protein